MVLGSYLAFGHLDPYPKAQKSRKFLQYMVFGPKNLEV